MARGVQAHHGRPLESAAGHEPHPHVHRVPQVRRWLRTSAYGCYELQAACQDELRGKQQEERVAAAGGASASGGSKAAAGAAPGRARPPTPHEDVPNTLLPLMSVMWPGKHASCC